MKNQIKMIDESRKKEKNISFFFKKGTIIGYDSALVISTLSFGTIIPSYLLIELLAT